jgi:hypothetical protein
VSGLASPRDDDLAVRQGVWRGAPPAGTGGPSSTSTAERGRTLVRICLAVVILSSAALAVAIYFGLWTVDFAYGHPFAGAVGMSILALIAAIGALIAFIVAIFATVWCRPRAFATATLVASVALPVVAVVGSTIIGFRALESHLTHNVSSMTGAVARMFAAFD